MSDIFISYEGEERPKAELLAEALKREGFTVFWDRDHTLGQLFDSYILDQLQASRCVVVLWSRTSVQSEWVQEEAQRGLRRGILVPVAVDEVTPPLGPSGRKQVIDLFGWNGDRTMPAYRKLVASIRDKLESESPSEPTYSRTMATVTRSVSTLDSEFLAPPPKRGRFALLIVLLLVAALFLVFEIFRPPSDLEEVDVADTPAPAPPSTARDAADAATGSEAPSTTAIPSAPRPSPPPSSSDLLSSVDERLEGSFLRAFFRLQAPASLARKQAEAATLVRRLTESGVRPEIQRWRLLQQHLALSLSEAGPASAQRAIARDSSWLESRRAHLEALESTLRQLWGDDDPWLPLLCAAREHSFESFASAAGCLVGEPSEPVSPRAATARFFEALNLFASARRSLGEGRWSLYRRRLDQASTTAEVSLELGRALTDELLAPVAEPGSLALVGRVAMYTGDRELSSRCFDELASGPWGAHYQVEGLHGRGLLSLQQGRLSDARTWLLRASRLATEHQLGFEPHASLAMVYLLDDRPDLRESAYRLLRAIQLAGADALSAPLTSAGLAHFLDMADETSQAIVVDGYRRALQAVGHPSASNDLATLQYLTGKQIYGGQYYYGRELLSLVLFARTLEAQQASSPGTVYRDAAESFDLYRRLATTQAFPRLPSTDFGAR